MDTQQATAYFYIIYLQYNTSHDNALAETKKLLTVLTSLAFIKNIWNIILLNKTNFLSYY